MLFLTLIIGCSLPHPAPLEEAELVYTVAELNSVEISDGAAVTTAPVVVVSPRTVGFPAFFVQDEGGGPYGLRVLLFGLLPAWPPAIGSVVTLSGTFVQGSGPSLGIKAVDDGEVLGRAVPVATPYGEDVGSFSLVSLSGVSVTSAADPLGRADTDGKVGLASVFGVDPPGWGEMGSLIGVVAEGQRVSLRTTADWSGSFAGEPPIEATIAEVGELSDGTPVRLSGVQVTPWSRDGRWALLQDENGVGLWVDGEAWGIDSSEEGAAGIWQGEVRSDGEGLRLRTWFEMEMNGTGEAIVTGDLVDGALVSLTVDEMEPADEYGDRVVGEVVLDNRFMDLEDLQPPLTVVGAVRLGEEVRLCPIRLE